MSYQNQNKNQDEKVSRIITNGYTKNSKGIKAIDFSDSLVSPNAKNYANVHSQGGSSGIPSRIKVAITNKNNGEQKAKYVTFNIEPYLAYEILEVCKRNVGETHIPYYKYAKKGNNSVRELTELTRFGWTARAFESCFVGFKTLLGGEVELFNALMSGNKKGFLVGQPQLLQNVLQNISQEQQMAYEITFANACDYEYEAEKVNIYGKNCEAGYRPVSFITIRRNSMNNGEPKRMPWYISIKNAETPFDEKKTNGTVKYDGRNLKNIREAFINLTDHDMMMHMLHITHYIEMWEMAYGIPIIKNGKALVEAEYRNNQQ